MTATTPECERQRPLEGSRLPERPGLLTWLLALLCAAPLAADLPELPAGTTHEGRILMLEDQRTLELEDGLPDLKEYLRSDDANLRARASLAAGRIGDPEAVARLRRSLRHEEPRVRRAAAFALGELEASRGTGPLVRALTDDDPQVRALAAEALSKVGDPDTVVHLERLLEKEAASPQRDPRVLERLLLTAWRLDPEGWTDEVLPLLDAADPRVADAAAYFLMRRWDPAARERLEAVLFSSAPPQRRAWAARALGFSEHPQSTDALLRAADDPFYHVAVEALRALRSHPRAAGVPGLVQAARVREPHVRLAALETIATLAEISMRPPQLRRTLEILVEKMDLAGPESEIALRGLVRLDAEMAVPFLQTALGAEDWRLRAAAAGALAQAPWPLAQDLLPMALEDTDPRVVWHGLAAHGEHLAEADEDDDAVRRRAGVVARRQLGHEDPVVRAVAAELARESGAGSLALFTTCFTAALDDALNDAALACLEGGVTAAEDDEEARELLEIALQTKDVILRRKAGLLSEERFGEFPRERVYPVTRSLLEGSGPTPRDTIEGERESNAETLLRAYSALASGDLLARLAYVRHEGGTVTLKLFADEAPMTVRNFQRLAEAGYFENIPIHRVVPDFVVQDGDPRGDGWGGPGWSIRDEINRRRYTEGAVGMALSGPDTGGSQWFVALSDQPHLDGGYTVFGHVIEGLDSLQRVEPGARILEIDVAR